MAINKMLTLDPERAGMLPLIVVAAAVRDLAGRVLMQRRPPGRPMAGLWEFPGGKLSAGEAPEDALVRELAEELGIAVEPVALRPIGFSTGSAEGRRLILLLWDCRRWAGEPRALHADEIGWFMPEEIARLDLPPADYPLIAWL